MRVVYICSPYRGEVAKNIELAKRISRKAALEGCLVLCPHLMYPRFLADEGEEREIGIRSGLKLLEMADEVWVAEGKISSGMAGEIARAAELGIPTRSVVDPAAAEEHLINALKCGKE